MFPNRGVAIHYHEDLYNQTISEFLLINKACSLSDVLVGDKGVGGWWVEGWGYDSRCQLVASVTFSGCFPVRGVARVKQL